MLLYAFGQKRVVSRLFGLNHFVIFWSFLILLLANGEFLVSGLFPQLTWANTPPALYHALLLLFDIISVVTLAAVLIAMVRRTFAPPYPGGRTGEAYVILGMIGMLMLAYFSLHAAEFAMGGNKLAEAGKFVPVTAWLAGQLHGSLHAIAEVAWWVHAVVLLAFLNYLPYSKHMHILTAIPNCFFARLEKANTQPRETFEDGTALRRRRPHRL